MREITNAYYYDPTLKVIYLEDPSATDHLKLVFVDEEGDSKIIRFMNSNNQINISELSPQELLSLKKYLFFERTHMFRYCKECNRLYAFNSTRAIGGEYSILERSCVIHKSQHIPIVHYKKDPTGMDEDYKDIRKFLTRERNMSWIELNSLTPTELCELKEFFKI